MTHDDDGLCEKAVHTVVLQDLAIILIPLIIALPLGIVINPDGFHGAVTGMIFYAGFVILINLTMTIRKTRTVGDRARDLVRRWRKDGS